LYVDNLQNITYEGKRLALEALQIKVAVEEDKVVFNGIIPITSSEIVSSESSISVV